MLSTVRELEFKHVGIEFSLSSMHMKKEAAEICSSLRLGMSTRLDLRPDGEGSLRAMLSRDSAHFDLVAVRCENKAVARRAAQEPRVDLLEFPSDPSQRRHVNFDDKEAELAAGYSCALEFDLSSLLKVNPIDQARLLSMMRSEFAVAMKKGVRVVVTSGADTIYGLRAPRDLASILSLLGADWETCLTSLSTHAMSILERSRLRDSERS